MLPYNSDEDEICKPDHLWCPSQAGAEKHKDKLWETIRRNADQLSTAPEQTAPCMNIGAKRESLRVFTKVAFGRPQRAPMAKRAPRLASSRPSSIWNSRGSPNEDGPEIARLPKSSGIPVPWSLCEHRSEVPAQKNQDATTFSVSIFVVNLCLRQA